MLLSLLVRALNCTGFGALRPHKVRVCVIYRSRGETERCCDEVIVQCKNIMKNSVKMLKGGNFNIRCVDGIFGISDLINVIFLCHDTAHFGNKQFLAFGCHQCQSFYYI